jgi:hypothetical protein
MISVESVFSSRLLISDPVLVSGSDYIDLNLKTRSDSEKLKLDLNQMSAIWN